MIPASTLSIRTILLFTMGALMALIIVLATRGLIADWQKAADLRVLIAVYVATIAFALSLCHCSFQLITFRVIQPVKAMAKTLATMATFPAPADCPDEIERLAQMLTAFQQNMKDNKGYTQALERSNKELDGLVYLSKRMDRMINDLLYFSRLVRQELAVQPTDINAVIADIKNTLDGFLAEHGARIVMPLPLPTISCDKFHITELFRNLITNAVKYNDAPEKIVEAGFLATHHFPHGDSASHVFYVRDNGRGIAREFHDEVFRIFKRLQAGKDSAEEGTGVGLTFVKKIIERHGGKIWLESEPGTGSVFYFTLEPAQPASMALAA